MGDRAASTVVGYAIGIVMVAMLAATLSIAANGLVETNQERATAAALEVHAERLTADIETAERVARQGTEASVVVETDLPRTIGGERYAITAATDDERSTLRLETRYSSDAVERIVTTTHPVEPGTVRGGPVTTSVDTASGERVVIERD